NSTVRCRRSPVSPSRGSASARIGEAPSSGSAHCAQKLASGALSEAHFGHSLLSDDAHWLQNREPAALSVPHFEQRIGSPLTRVTAPRSITHRDDATND